jgi:hypothetical protein
MSEIVAIAAKRRDRAAAGLCRGQKDHGATATDHATKLAMGDDVKAFFQAEYHALGRWSIGKRVRDRSW